MKKCFSILVFCLVFCCASAINKIAYTYDAAGNRTSRRYVVDLRSASVVKSENPDTIAIKNQLGEPEITVYPNPTKGALSVKITGSSEEQKIDMKLYSPQGALLKNIIKTSETTLIDMTSYPSGWYILRVIIDKKPIEFKIIKD